jgi:hypothetical protein
MTKKNFTSHYLKLCMTMLALFNYVDAKQITKPTNIPTKMQPGSRPSPKISSGHTKNDPEVLDINKSVKIVNSQHDCNINKWDNNPDEACQCCLTYGEGRFGEEQTADQIIDYCTNTSKQCSPTSIANIRTKYNAQNMSSEDFLYNLYNQTTVVHKMNIHPSLLKSNGNLTENGLASILAQAYGEGKLKNKNFNKKECLKVESLGSGSGYNTVQLFLVSSTCTPSLQPLLYIVKESKKGLTESTNLKQVEEYPGMKDLIAPNVVKDFPTIALPFFYFSYHPHHQNIHYIATMPAAKGSVLFDLLNEFRDDQSQKNADRIKKAYHILGKELGNFHKRFMQPIPGKKLGKTVAHGDLHVHNIFYDGEHFTFIDDETMIRSFKKLKVPKIDFMRLIFPPFSSNDTIYQFKEIIKGVKPGTYLNLTLTPLIKAYISVFPAQDRKQLLHDLREIFTTDIKADPLNFDPDYIKEIVTKYINPIFDNIEKTLSK